MEISIHEGKIRPLSDRENTLCETIHESRNSILLTE